MDNDDKKYIPSLRFPEFLNDGEWVVKTFENIVEINSGKDYKHLDSGNIPVYGTGGYMLSVNDKLSDVDAVGIGRKGTIDKPQFLKAPFWTVDTLFYLINKNEYNINFILYLAETIDWKKYSEQTGVPSLSKATISKIKTIVPNVIKTKTEEQKRIADCLSSLDKHIDATKRKLDQLKEHKKGLMQRLFPTKGKTIPELRFPEFKDDGEWEILPLDNDIFPFVSNNTISRAELNYNSGIVQNVHYGDVLIKYREYLNVKNEKLPFITDTQNVQKYDNAKLENGDIIIADTAEDETVGKCTEIQEIANKIIVSGLHTIAIRSKIKFAKYYLGFYMNSNSFREQIYHLMQGIKVLSISKTAIRQTKICFPKSLIEQSKIAGCLLDLDNLIISFENKIKALELHKKGLMQQLFPKL